MRTMDRQAHLEAKIAKVKQELMQLGDLRPGTLSAQYNGPSRTSCAASPPFCVGLVSPYPDTKVSLMRAAKRRAA